jgi:hypothetical protein
MTKYLGDFAAGVTVRGTFNTRAKATGAPITLAGTPAVAVYKDGSTTETTTGVASISVDFDARTGHHLYAITTSDAFYAAGSDYRIVLTAGTVDGESVVGVEVGSFSILNRSPLTTLGTNAPADWINAAAIAADAITDAKVANDVTIASVTGAVGSVTGSVGSVTGNVGGSVGSVVGAVGSVTAPVTAGTVSDKTGYSLTATTGLGNQTANITGNLTGSVGSVTGAVGSVTGSVGSVTGSVGSVTGNVGGNVVGSVGSVTGGATATALADVATEVGKIPRAASALAAGSFTVEVVNGQVISGGQSVDMEYK